MEAEIDLYKKMVSRKEENRDDRDRRQMLSLFCVEAKEKKEGQFIMPGTFTSPLKMVPRKPLLINDSNNSGPDLAMIGPDGQILDQTY